MGSVRFVTDPEFRKRKKKKEKNDEMNERYDDIRSAHWQCHW